jgi:hypothetical protein
VATTPSAKLGIPLPVAGSQEPFTVAAYNNAINTLDGVAGATVVTSTTRPTSPFSGQLIFETDTNESFVWDGTAWEAVSGSIAPGSITATELATDAVTTIKIDDDAVTTAKILDANVTTAKIADANVTSAKLGPGTVLQIVQSVKTDVFTAGTANSWLAVTGLSATITPRATSSKIFILTDVKAGVASSDNRAVFIRITGGNAGQYVGDSVGSRIRAIGASVQLSNLNLRQVTIPIAANYLDSPATTSAVTYQVEIYSSGGTGARVNQAGQDSNDTLYAIQASSITLMEVAG